MGFNDDESIKVVVMISYIDSVDKLIEKLSLETRIVCKYHFFNPISDEKIVAIESKNDVKVSESFRHFYQKSNGLQLMWTVRTAPFYKEVEAYFGKVACAWGKIEDLYRVDFKLELLPIEKAVKKGTDYFRKKAFVFECLNHSYGLSLLPNQRPDLEYHILKHKFPELDFRGSDTSQINRSLMRGIASKAKPIIEEELEEMIGLHHLFLDSGGIGGQWQILSTGTGLVLSVYIGARGNEGEQANLARRNLSQLKNLEHLDLPYADFCAVYGEGLNFSKSNLSHSTLTDAFMANSSFEAANLSYCDFSRADLRGVSFRNANLSHCDFENACLDGADLRGAKWRGASFKGALVKDLRH